MAHLAFDYQPDHDFIAAQIEAEITAAVAGGTVITGPWTTRYTAAGPDTISTTT